MEGAVVLRSLSCTPLVCTRFFARSSHKLTRLSSLSSLPRRHRSIPNLDSRSRLRQHLSLFSTAPRSSVQLTRHFSSLSPKAITTSPSQPSSVFGADDDITEKLGFEKVSEQFIDECKSKAVLYNHKKTGADIMSVSNDDENKVFGIVFRTPPLY